MDWEKIAENLAAAAELQMRHGPDCEYNFCPINECPTCHALFQKNMELALNAFKKAKKSCSR